MDTFVLIASLVVAWLVTSAALALIVSLIMRVRDKEDSDGKSGP